MYSKDVNWLTASAARALSPLSAQFDLIARGIALEAAASAAM
jgi:hypothetical protein